jgi:regulator of protease activity HflC (stomatin/prohibitin superfamily)
MQVTAWGIVALAALGLSAIAWVRARAVKHRITVQEGSVGLEYVDGRLARTLPAGSYWTWPRNIEIEHIDLREAVTTLSSQEMLTSDMLAVKISLFLRWKVTDAEIFRRANRQYTDPVHDHAQVLLRECVAVRTLDVVLAERSGILEGFAERLAERVAGGGVEVTRVDLRDLTLSGAAKTAYADVWKAKKEGEAALERARAEQASLRSLANAARMLKGNPELMNLRLLQALSGGPGKPAPTVVLGGGGGLMPVSREIGTAPTEAEGEA